MKTCFLIALLVVMCPVLSVSQQMTAPNRLKTVPTLNLDAFLGQWLVMYASKIPLESTLLNAFCVSENISQDEIRKNTVSLKVDFTYKYLPNHITFLIESFLILLFKYKQPFWTDSQVLWICSELRLSGLSRQVETGPDRRVGEDGHGWRHDRLLDTRRGDRYRPISIR